MDMEAYKQWLEQRAEYGLLDLLKDCELNSLNQRLTLAMPTAEDFASSPP